MKNISLTLVTIASAAPIFAANGDNNQPTRKNVLFLLADDLQTEALRNLGDRTPGSKVINDFIDSSTRFDRCYTMGSFGGALSMPSRAMLMTGRTLYETSADGSVIHAHNKTLPEVLRSEGYRTFSTGKWHSDYQSYNRSFSEAENIFFGGMHQYETKGHTAPRLQHYREDCQYSNETMFIGDKFSSEMFADAAIEFINSTKGGEEPFFCYVAFTSPHDPHNLMPDYSNPLDSTLMPLPINYAPQHAFDNGELKIRDEMVAPAPRTPEVILEQNALYGGMINEVGIQIGRVLEALENSGQLDNTIIVFSADNGLAMGRHGLMGKQSLYQHSIGVPLAIKDAGQTKSYVSNGLCYLADVNATLYDMLDVEKPASVTTKSLKSALKGGKTERDALMLAYSSIHRAVVWNEMKYIIYNVDKKVTKQLFDLKKDPHEMNNLANDAKYAKTIDKYHNKLSELMKQNGDYCDIDKAIWWSDGHKITWQEGLNMIK